MNNPNFIGIDFSMNSAAICVLTNNEYKFYAFPRGITKAMKENLELSDVFVKVMPKEKFNSKLLADKERYNSKDADYAITTVIETLTDFLNTETKIGIEGIAFMARGNSIAQFAGYHYILRYLLSKHVSYENLFVFAPNSVKKTAGKGNLKKEQMIEVFKSCNDEKLKDNKFFKMMNNHYDLFQTKGGNFLKPIDDLVDSYWTLQTLLDSF